MYINPNSRNQSPSHAINPKTESKAQMEELDNNCQEDNNKEQKWTPIKVMHQQQPNPPNKNNTQQQDWVSILNKNSTGTATNADDFTKSFMNDLQAKHPTASEAFGQNMTAPRRGKGVLKQQEPGMRVPHCGGCTEQIR